MKSEKNFLKRSSSESEAQPVKSGVYPVLMPPPWKQKGSPQAPRTYRGFLLGSIMVIVQMDIILTGLSQFYES